MTEPSQPRNYWGELSTERLIEGYVKPHIQKAEIEGAHVRALMLEEVAERLGHLCEYEALFKLSWEADMRAIKRWQKAHPGNNLTWPDHADMVVWLLDQIENPST